MVSLVEPMNAISTGRVRAVFRREDKNARVRRVGKIASV